MLGSWPALSSSFALHLELRPLVATPTSIRNSVYLFTRSPLSSRTCHRLLRQVCSVCHLRKHGCINASIIYFYFVGSVKRMSSYLCYVCIFISLHSTLGSSATKPLTWCSDRVMFVSCVSQIPCFIRVCAQYSYSQVHAIGSLLFYRHNSLFLFLSCTSNSQSFCLFSLKHVSCSFPLIVLVSSLPGLLWITFSNPSRPLIP